MYHQTHHPSGRHIHNAVFDWRLLRPGQERREPAEKHVVHSRQLDYLYCQLEQLKINMREKQTSLAEIIDVQKKKIENQGHVILDLDQKLKHNQMAKKKTEDFVFRDIVKNQETGPETTEENKTASIKASSKNFRELYQKAKTMKDCEEKSEEYEEIDLSEDDDNDSFITIDDDYQDDDDDDGASDSTLENSQSSDSGYTDGSSYGVNPLFSIQANDGTEACQEDFVFFNQKADETRTPPSSQQIFGSLKKSHRIVIINNEAALVCNESCLI